MNKELTESEIKALAPDWATHCSIEFWLGTNVIKFFNGYRVAVYNVDQGRMLKALMKGPIPSHAKSLYSIPDLENHEWSDSSICVDVQDDKVVIMTQNHDVITMNEQDLIVLCNAIDLHVTKFL